MNNFMHNINNEISQAINESPVSRLDKEREYFKSIPLLNSLPTKKNIKFQKNLWSIIKVKNNLYQLDLRTVIIEFILKI